MYSTPYRVYTDTDAGLELQQQGLAQRRPRGDTLGPSADVRFSLLLDDGPPER